MGGEIAYIDKTINHPHFDDKTYVNDIALLKLKEDVQYNEKVQPINLASRNFDIIEDLNVTATSYS